ncbi:MAG: methyl-accepting chemotaxis protein [Ghiorsea sp.]
MQEMNPEHQLELKKLFDAVSSGNFTFRVSPNNPLSHSANNMLQWLDEMQLKELKDKVNLSIAGFESTINMAKLQQVGDAVASRTETMAAATEEMSITVQMMAEQADKVGIQSTETKGAVTEGSDAMNRIREVMISTTEQMEGVTDEVRRLSDISQEIDQLLLTIRKISDQTNLLALNATIEAARAGEAGRGFAVVAGEVKQLSHQTKDAADNIVEKSNNIQKAVTTVVQQMESMSTSVHLASEVVETGQNAMSSIVSGMEQVDESVYGIHQATKDQSIASAEIAEGVTSSSNDAQTMTAKTLAILDQTDQMDMMLRQDLSEFSELQITDAVIQLAKSDHMFWKKRLIDMILGRGNIDISEVTDHHNCRLGKWYDNDGKTHYGTNSSFKKLEDPHAKMHKMAKEAVSLFNSGQTEDAILKVDAIGDLSANVVSCLEQLESS